MRRLILISFLLMLSFLPVSAQYLWQVESDKHRFEIQVDTIREGDSDFFYYTYSIPKILVYPRQGDAQPQEIHPMSNGISKTGMLKRSEIVKLVDINFDGILDLELYDVQMMYLSASHFWIYNPETNLLEPDHHLAKLTDLKLLRKQKMIYSYFHVGPNQFGHSLWQWQGGKLELVIREELMTDDNETGFLYDLELGDGDGTRKIDQPNPYQYDIPRDREMYLYNLYLKYKDQ